MAYRCKTLIATEGDSSNQEKRLSICLVADGFSFSVTSPDGILYAFGEAEGQHATSITDATRDIKAVFAVNDGRRKLEIPFTEQAVLSTISRQTSLNITANSIKYNQQTIYFFTLGFVIVARMGIDILV